MEATIRETLISYNATETEAVALLRIDLLSPYLALEVSFAVRWTTALGER